MKLLIVAVLRQLTAQPWATASVLAGITLAILSMVAVHLLSEAAKNELSRAAPESVFGWTHRLRRDGLTEQDYFGLRRAWRQGQLAGIEAMVPVLEGTAVVTAPDGPVRVRIIGVDPLALTQRALADSTGRAGAMGPRVWLVGDGALLAGGLDIALGSTLRFQDGGGSVVIGGRFDMGYAITEPVLIMDIGAAQDALAQPGRLTSIALVQGDRPDRWSAWVGRLFPGLGSPLGTSVVRFRVDGFYVESVADGGPRLFANAVLFNLGALSLLGTVVAGFLIHQGAVNSIRQRELVMDRLRAMGADQRLFVAHVALEGTVVCAIGSLLGILLGWGVAQGLANAVLDGASGGSGLRLDRSALAWAAGKGLVFGTTVGLASMLLAYLSVVGFQTKVRLRALALLGCALVSGTGMAFESSGVAGALLAIAGAACAVALLVGPTLRLAIWKILPGQVGWLGTLNRRAVADRRADVGVALAGLVIALATAIGMSAMVLSFREAFAQMLDQRLGADVYLQSDSSFDAPAIAEVAALTGGTARVFGERRADGWIDAPGDRQVEIGLVFDSDSPALLARYGYAGPVPLTGALVSEATARRHGIAIDDELSVAGPNGRASLIVQGVFRDYGAPGARGVISTAVGGRLFGKQAPPRSISVDYGDSGDSRESRGQQLAALRDLAASRGWRFRSVGAVRQRAMEIFDRTFRISDALVILAVMVGVVGLYNALAAVRLRRAHEFRLLRGMGLSSLEFLRLDVGHAAWLGVYALMLAAPLGIGIGWLLCEIVNPRSFGWSMPLVLSIESMLLPLLGSLAAVLLAGVLPGVLTGLRGALGAR